MPEIIENDLAEFGSSRVRVVDDPIHSGALGALKLSQDMPETEWENL
jgi:hypothetical protein